jgi:uncharacterized protein (DUF58 family)
LLALAIAAWVAVTLVPILAKRTPLRWIGQKVEYRITRAGWLYFGVTLLVALAALNTGNNLLFLILACLVSVILMSGILSSISLAGVDLRIELPEHIFAGQTVRATVELANEKLTLPSFALRVEAVVERNAPPAAVVDQPVFFPYLPRQQHEARRPSHISPARLAVLFASLLAFLWLPQIGAFPSDPARVYPSVRSGATDRNRGEGSIEARQGRRISTPSAIMSQATAPATCTGKLRHA